MWVLVLLSCLVSFLLLWWLLLRRQRGLLHLVVWLNVELDFLARQGTDSAVVSLVSAIHLFCSCEDVDCLLDLHFEVLAMRRDWLGGFITVVLERGALSCGLGFET